MIKVFGKTDKSFQSNGDKIVHPLKAKIHKEDNGAYHLDIEAGLEYVEFIVAGNIVVANTPQGEQAFRISNPKLTKTKIIAKAYHVFYDSKNFLVEECIFENANCNDALKELINSANAENCLTAYSNIEQRNSLSFVRIPLYDAIQNVLKAYGGHIVRDNFNFAIKESIGSDNGITIQYRKNLKDITSEENWDNVVTKLLPLGKGELQLNAINENESIFIESAIQYPIPYTKAVSFMQDHIKEEDYPNEVDYKQALLDDLRKQAIEYLNINCVPQVNYTLKANINHIVDIGDTVQVIDERLNLQLTAKIISFDYDCILCKYTEVEFGNFKKTLSGLVDGITANVGESVKQQISAATNVLNGSIIQSKQEIQSVLKDSYVVYGGDCILILDNLPKESARNVLKIDKNGIEHSQTGINGVYVTVWHIDNIFDANNVKISNFAADIIKGGTLNIGSNSNSDTLIKIKDKSGNITGQLDDEGLKMFIGNGSLLKINNEVGFTFYDVEGNQIFAIKNNIIKYRNIITCTLKEQISNPTLGNYTKIPLKVANSVGEKLIVSSEGGVVIGNSISKVLVSGAVLSEVNDPSLKLCLVKNSYSDENILAISKGILTPQVIDIQPNETLYLFYYIENSNDAINNATLTVEVIE